VGLANGAKHDGVFGIWYGKAPGVDRTGDAFKHANFAGTAPHGGVLAIAGDDHMCKSSTLPSQSEFAFQDAEIPVLSPSGVQETLDYGLYGIAMSRFSGLWVGMIALADTMDSAAIVGVGPSHAPLMHVPFDLTEGGVSIRASDTPMDKEARLRLVRLPAAQAFARAHGLDRVVLAAKRPRLGIVCVGAGVGAVYEALDALGYAPEEAAEAGIAVFKVGMPWPLEPHAITQFARACETLLVVENKRDLVEHQLKAHLYDAGGPRPQILGKRDALGAPLLSEIGALTTPAVAKAIDAMLPPELRKPAAAAYFARVRKSLDAAAALEASVHRKPHFCSGCPHSTSTVVPEGSRALAGIGCHYMATFMGRADFGSHMGGEGAAWIGQAPFTEESHVFVNMGDGTYAHSGSLAIRAAISAKINATYKILYNGAVAMTGGQDVDGGQSVADFVHQLRGEGAAKVVVVADDPSRHKDTLRSVVDIYPRAKLDEVQRDLRTTSGVTILIYDQVCATERRRKAKRGLATLPTRRAFINTAVCEGCGDCSKQSNCLSVEPVETELGLKRRINQSSCNQDLRCVDGFCPSFVTVGGARNAEREKPHRKIDASSLPSPQLPPLDRVYSLVFTGIGGTGVTTISAVLGMAAYLDGLAVSTLDMAGLAQKGGPVTSHIRFARDPVEIHSPRTSPAAADALIAGDLAVADGAEALALYDARRTFAVANTDLLPTAEFIAQRDKRFDGERVARRLRKAVASLETLHADALSEHHLFDQIYANSILLGFAWGKGLVPVSAEAIQEAFRMNGASAAENLLAFDIGRIAALAPDRLEPLKPQAPAPKSLDETIAHRAGLLTAYQNEAYAERYRALVGHVRAKEAAAGLGERLTLAVAKNAYKLMAYKDEYEVARLYTDGTWTKALRETFAGDFKLRFHLAPPLLAKQNKATGRPEKRAFGPWMLPAFYVLAKLKGLRGGPFDLFGRTPERRMERRLRDEYEALVRALAEDLKPARHDLVVKLAELPDRIRGFGPVKEKAMREAEAERAKLLAALAKAEQPAPVLEPVP
jgi:indolepyruvate ferredoxin oxidoreductase